ncbi:FAD-binding oxidoreductase [Actinoplanes bogorensis]|uniref:FAD-binding oxidoreductase n=1 Tax=Paractinoplanes bogorensis TaxID=1610840 RepID=A0ABS5YNL2_9ACTN|nr:FAD-binding oxidoreductase [Actinoplanes bogorensis]MBU2665050.1 FAD-binding oxidoreductase [Actinoplanes bogorensis]
MLGLTAEVIRPGDDNYDRARRVFLGRVDRHPSMIVRAVDAADVSAVIRYARDAHVPLAVRSGGHGWHGVQNDAIVLDLSLMRSVTIDPTTHTAWAEPGVTAAQYVAAAGEHGLTTGFGDTGSVGLGGLTVGGGVGYLVRKHGLTIDALLAAEVVTADGELVRADESTHPDLFWAIRGGGGNFGVVTRLKFRLHPVSTVLGGLLVLPATSHVLADYLAVSDAAPEELSSILNVMTAPPLPFLPERWHGRPVAMANIVHAGDPEAGERAVAPLRALAEPIADLVRPMAYGEMFAGEEETGIHPLSVGRTWFADELSEPDLAVALRHLESATAEPAVLQLRVLGGAMARVPSGATAMAHRERRLMIAAAAVFADPAELGEQTAWLHGLLTDLKHTQHGAYVNFTHEDAQDRLHEIYPRPTYARLASIKRRYDPGNMFRFNANIRPA